jgi:hypothetical protein
MKKQVITKAWKLAIPLLIVTVLTGCISDYDSAYKLNRPTPYFNPDHPPIVATKLAEGTVERCTNHLDDDNNGLIDCLDPVCKELEICKAKIPDSVLVLHEDTQDKCRNSLDDDGDGNIDCADSECTVFQFCDSIPIIIPPTENTYETCSDKMDNDKDGLIDCLDPDCYKNIRECLAVIPPILQENSLALCTDKSDNDKDGQVDCADKDCEFLYVCKKIKPPDTLLPGRILIMPPKIPSIPKDMLEFEDFVEPGIAAYNGWPFVEGEGMRLDKAFYNTPKNLIVYGLILDYPDAGSKDSTGVEFEACHCSDRSGPTAKCKVSTNFPVGQSVGGQYASASNYPAPWNVCLTFLHASEIYSYVVEVKTKGTYKMFIAGNTANQTDAAGLAWSATSKGFDITIDVKDFSLFNTFLHIKAPIILPNNNHPPSVDGVQWFRTVEWDPVTVVFPDNMPDRVVLLFESDGHPYNVDYIRFEKL